VFYNSNNKAGASKSVIVAKSKFQSKQPEVAAANQKSKHCVRQN
jgi:hypothetical protein